MPETNKQFVERVRKSFEPLPEGEDHKAVEELDPADMAEDLLEAVDRIEQLEQQVKI